MDKKLYLFAELDDSFQIDGFKNIKMRNGLIEERTDDIPYHITLCSYSIEKENYLVDLLDRISIDFTSINIVFGGLGTCERVLYIRPDINNDKLNELYTYLGENCLYEDNNLSRTVTLRIDKPENITEMYSKICKMFRPKKGIIKYISLYEFYPKKFIKRIVLK